MKKNAWFHVLPMILVSFALCAGIVTVAVQNGMLQKRVAALEVRTVETQMDVTAVTASSSTGATAQQQRGTSVPELSYTDQQISDMSKVLHNLVKTVSDISQKTHVNPEWFSYQDYHLALSYPPFVKSVSAGTDSRDGSEYRRMYFEDGNALEIQTRNITSTTTLEQLCSNSQGSIIEIHNVHNVIKACKNLGADGGMESWADREDLYIIVPWTGIYKLFTISFISASMNRYCEEKDVQLCTDNQKISASFKRFVEGVKATIVSPVPTPTGY